MGFLEERDLNSLPTIPEYYRGKTLFITGGTGFMGQALIEKLLYSCEDLDRIYLLLRPKRGKTTQERAKGLYEEICFNRLRKEKPGLYETKVFGIAGDVGQAELGLSEEDKAMLIDRVNIIFHSAASVRFDDFLTTSVDMNVRGTIRMVDLAKQMQKLSAFIHVSTCYSNSNKGEFIEEKLYPPHADWRDTLEICDNIHKDTQNALMTKYLGGIPNTYAFSKQLTEHMLAEYRGLLPIVIMRPSVVIASATEPLPGWTANFNGPVGMHIGVGKGIISVVLGDLNVRTDYIPVDSCIKTFIAASWLRGTKKLEATDDIAIYQCSGYNIYELIPLKDITDMALVESMKNPMKYVLKVPSVTIVNSVAWFYIQFIIFQLLPSILGDVILCLLGRKPMLVKLQRKVYIANIALYYYMKREWRFGNTNFLRLRSSIKEEDKAHFYDQLEEIRKDISKYYFNCIDGAKLCLLKEPIEDLPKARAHLFRVQVVTYLIKFLFYGYITWMIFKTEYFQDILKSLGCDSYLSML